jgi:hypothetical protein
MKESYGEGVATHTGPESCVGVRNGVGRSVDRGKDRPGIHPRRPNLRDADALGAGGRPHHARHRETCGSPARSEPPSMFGHISVETQESGSGRC